ncbi:SUMF1/EgtB/PvdO family nonheme iron enzyme [Myxococcota bacterium]|nr:SUMF1/EgtB/PvdO family nonheme iron enzyme [Myxococcota bacterium]
MLRKMAVWLVGLVLLAGVVGLEARSKGEIVLEVVGEGQNVGAQKPGGKVVAVLVGINTYKDDRFRRLRYAEKDARDMKKYLLSMGVKSRDIKLLVGQQATRRAIQRALYVWLPKKVGPKDGVFVFFSGHGEKWGVKDYIVPYDAEADALEISGLLGAAVERSLNRLRVRQQVLVLDTCFSRAIASEYVAMMANVRPRSNFLPNTHLKRFQGRGRVVFASSDGNEVSLEPKNLGNGLYTHYFLKGLRGEADKDGDKCITAREVHDYVSVKVSVHAKGKQTPAWDQNSTKEILLVRMPGCGQRVASTGTSGTGGSSGTPPSGGGWGVLVVSADVGGVEVYVGPVYRALLLKSGERTRLRLRAGQHEVTLKKQGYKDQSVLVQVEAGGELPLERRMIRDDAEAVVQRPTPPRQPPLVASAQPSRASWPTEPSAGQGHQFMVKRQTFRVRWIPAGSFVMGSPENESGRDSDEGPQRSVTISKGYWMLESEVTQGQYKALMGSNPSRFSSCGDNCPVERVSWHQARAFADKLSRVQGLAPCTTTGRGIFRCKGWRLPTEAEWEYAARARSTGARYGEVDDVAWYGGNSKGKTHPVGKQSANGWGLKDMLGNVWEWTMDVEGSYAGMSTQDPLRSSGSTKRVFRGGRWASVARFVRSAFRYFSAPTYRGYFLGFRLLRY